MDFDTYVNQLVMSFRETEEEFIFNTVSPFCDNIMQKKINKEELINALRRYRTLQSENNFLKEENNYLKEKLAEIEAILETIKESLYS